LTPDLDREELRGLLDFATGIAREAGALTLRWFGGMVEHEDKTDGSPVTPADREVERHLRARIAERWPGHGILGEEMGESNPGARVRWILDPIDGTRSFLRGVPLYGVLIGVEVEGEAAVGVMHFPALRETVAGAAGLGCAWNGRPCKVSGVASMAEATVLATDPIAHLDRPEEGGWERIQRRADLARGWGDCYGHALVATGRAEVMLDSVLHPWDAAPLLPILTEAGGRFSTLQGEATIHGTSGVSTNGLLHEEVLRELAGSGR
jgi:histidinol-phosphatase